MPTREEKIAFIQRKQKEEFIRSRLLEEAENEKQAEDQGQTYEPPETLGQYMAETGEDLLKGMGKGSSFGFGDELAGVLNVGVDAASGLANKINPEWGYEDDLSIGESYKEGRDYARKDYAMSEDRSPIASTVGEVGGAIASGIVTGGHGLTAMTAEGAAYGLGESEADLLEGELGQAAWDTAKGAALGYGTGKVMQKGGHLLKKGYSKLKGKVKPSQGDMASDAAADILEMTPKQRRVAMEKRVPQATGQSTSVYEELPKFLKKEGGYGFTGSVKKSANKIDEVLERSGKEIGNIESQYDDLFQRAIDNDKIAKVSKNIDKGRDTLDKGRDTLDKEALNEGYGKLLRQKVEDIADPAMATVRNKIARRGQEMAYDFSSLGAKLRKSMLAPIKGIPGYESQVRKLTRYIKSVENKGKIVSLKDLQDFRKKTDDLIKGWDKSNEVLPQYTKMLRQVRSDINTHVKDKMLPGFENMAKELLDAGHIKQSEFKKMESLRDKLFKANKNYQMGMVLGEQMSQAIGKKDSRRLMSLTDFIIGGSGALSGDPTSAMAAVAAKKTAEALKPRISLYGKEIAEGAGKMVKPAIIQQGAEAITSPEAPQSPKSAAQGTKWEANFQGDDPKLNAVNHKVLMSSDPEYAKRFLPNKED